MGMGGQRHATAALPQEAGWASEPVWTGAENLAPTRIRSPDRSARSESLYWLHYPGSVIYTYICTVSDAAFALNPRLKKNQQVCYNPGGGWGAVGWGIQADNFLPYEFSVSFPIQLFEITTNSDQFYRTLHLKLDVATI